MTQTSEIKYMFEKSPSAWIPCYELIKYSLQYNARIFELRQQGMNIVNKTKRVNGKKHSWYKYIPEGSLF